MIGHRALLGALLGSLLAPLSVQAAVLASPSGVPILAGGALVTPLAAAPPATGTTSLNLQDMVASYGTSGPKPPVVVQRAPGRDDRDVPVVVGYTGSAPAGIRGRVVDADTLAAVTPWASLGGLTCTGGTCAGTLPTVPVGMTYLYELQDGTTQPTSGPLFVRSATRFGVGVNVVAQGQSNQLGTFGGGFGAGYAPPGYGSEGAAWAAGPRGAIYDPAGWHAPSNGNPGFGPSAAVNTATDNVYGFIRLVSAGLSAKYGRPVPVGLTLWAFNSNSIEQFLPGAVHHSEFLGASGHDVTATTYGAGTPPPYNAGGIEVFLWNQGEANQNDTQIVYQGKLGTLHQGVLTAVQPYGWTGTTLKFLPNILGTISGANGVEAIRSAEAAYVASARAQGLTGADIGWTATDLPLQDGLHYGAATSTRRALRRTVQGVLYAAGAAPYGGKGPGIAGITRLSATTYQVGVQHDGGTGLQLPTGCTSATGFAANSASDFSGTDAAVTATLVGGGIRLTVPAGSPVPLAIKYLGAKIGTAASAAPDVSCAVYDNAVYPYWPGKAADSDTEALGLPLRPSVGAVVVP